MFVIPKDKLTIVDPQRMDVIAPEGRDVGSDNSAYWERRAADGDVTIVPVDQVPAAIATLEKADTARAEAARKAKEEADAKAAAAKPATPTPAPAPKQTGQK